MTAIQPPIVIAEGWDVSLHESTEDAAVQLEPIDVSEGVYRCYDANGRLLSVDTDGKAIRFRVAESVDYGAELSELLKGFLERVRVPVAPNADLSELIRTCVSAGYLHRRR